MRVDDFNVSAFLSVEEVEIGVPLRIRECKVAAIGQGMARANRALVWFDAADRALTFSPTNSTWMRDQGFPDTEDWIGLAVTFDRIPVTMRDGSVVPALRLVKVEKVAPLTEVPDPAAPNFTDGSKVGRGKRGGA